MGKNKNRILEEKHLAKSTLGSPRKRVDNIKMAFGKFILKVWDRFSFDGGCLLGYCTAW
jgi:hypothetical protein